MNDYLYGRECAPNERVIQLERVEAVERERDEFKTQLEAWQKVFGTSQLTHALARLEVAEESVKRLQMERDALGKEYTLLLQGKHLPQRQDSLTDQMRDVIPLATKAGCYDAADYLRRVVEDVDHR